MIFVYFTLNLSCIGIAVLMGIISYHDKGFTETCMALIVQTVLIITAYLANYLHFYNFVSRSFLIYFGRVLSDSQFYE